MRRLLNWLFPAVHRHNFVRTCRLVNPRREVFECSCGERSIVTPGGLGIADVVVRSYGKNSIENALQNVGQLSGSRLLSVDDMQGLLYKEGSM